MQHKLVFIETQDVVETTLALDNFRRACDCGRGAVFFRWGGDARMGGWAGGGRGGAASPGGGPARYSIARPASHAALWRPPTPPAVLRAARWRRALISTGTTGGAW